MPSNRQPNKLFEICKDYVNSLIIKLVISFSVYHESEIDPKLQSVQSYISRSICPHLIDTLLQTVDPCGQLNEYQKFMLLKILMHPTMITFSTRFKLPSKDYFYEVRLKELKRLVVLNLSMVCTDEILEVVGNNCLMLQVIHIVSKIGCVTNKSKKQLNALKLKFFVSDKGLEHLHKCKFLKTIVMNKVTRSNCGGRKITHDGIRKLLQALPAVQFISYNDMGLVLEHGLSDTEKFNLLHLHDGHIKPEHIDIFFKHSPNLKGLCLMSPTTSLDSSIPETCLTKLAESELSLSSLALGLFPLEEAFVNFLSVKGLHLTSLFLFNYISITLESIYLIGLYCPLIEYLEVNLVVNGDSGDGILSKIANKKLFTRLQILKIIGSSWDPHVIVPLCINNALHLNQLIWDNRCYYNYIDKVILNLLKINPLVNLTCISLLGGFCVTAKTLTKFILVMENLENVTVTKGSGYLNYLEQLKIDNNLNLIIKSDSITENFVMTYGNCFCYYWEMGSMRKWLIDT